MNENASMIRAINPNGSNQASNQDYKSWSPNHDDGADHSSEYQFIYVWDDPPKEPVAYGFPSNHFEVEYLGRTL